MAVVEVTVVPLGTAETSLSAFVAQAVRVLRQSGLRHELTAMGTVITGDLDDILPVVKQMHESCFDSGALRVLTQIRIDDRRDCAASPEQKIRSVMNRLSTDS